MLKKISNNIFSVFPFLVTLFLFVPFSMVMAFSEANSSFWTLMEVLAMGVIPAIISLTILIAAFILFVKLFMFLAGSGDEEGSTGGKIKSALIGGGIFVVLFGLFVGGGYLRNNYTTKVFKEKLDQQKRDYTLSFVVDTNKEMETKLCYEKALELLKNNKREELKPIFAYYDNTNEANKHLEIRFYKNNVWARTECFYDKGLVRIENLIEKDDNPLDAQAGVVPDYIFDFGYEKAKELLISNPVFLKYKSKYPKLIKNELEKVSVRDSKNGYKNELLADFGWEWTFNYGADPDWGNDTKNGGIVFAVNPGSKKVTVTYKVNVD